MTMSKIGLVLSGGASKCIAHLGVLKALNEMGVKIDYIAAVSGGALLGSVVASGISPKEALDIIVNKANFSFYFPSFRSGGLFTMSRIRNLYEETLPVKTFEELKIPMVVVATDISEGKTHYFQHGDLIQPIIASSSYPIIFEPVMINGHLYLDGGIMNNFPVEIAKKMTDITIGSYVGNIDPMDKDSSIKRVMFRSLSLAISEADKHRIKLPDVLIKPLGLGNYPMFDFASGKDIYKIGYQTTIAKEQEILNVLKNRY